MKKILIYLTAFLLLFTLTSCNKLGKNNKKKEVDYTHPTVITKTVNEPNPDIELGVYEKYKPLIDVLITYRKTNFRQCPSTGDEELDKALFGIKQKNENASVASGADVFRLVSARYLLHDIDEDGVPELIISCDFGGNKASGYGINNYFLTIRRGKVLYLNLVPNGFPVWNGEILLANETTLAVQTITNTSKRTDYYHLNGDDFSLIASKNLHLVWSDLEATYNLKTSYFTFTSDTLSKEINENEFNKILKPTDIETVWNELIDYY